MKFKRLVDYWGENEIMTVLWMVQPHAELVGYKRDLRGNSMIVFYRLPWEIEALDHRIDFLPEDIYIVEKGDIPEDGKPLEDGNILEQYQKFMVAQGYSEVWLNNPYC